MRLKRLELKGFKSFADKTIINFSEDVIGVVGSNGCGKSNIVDSIRWVLGEQKTSQLRSDNMTNVIFNGTKGRKAAGFADVTLIFENNKDVLPTEYKEVSIKRVLYKDGSSEYRLNEVKCRLKDISNLLVDTGMGSNSYAIIALNMVDDLLQDKENARLQLFEQAAGISKYKTRKKETLRKLRGTEADLLRVEDLLAEIEKNLKTLERQAKRAKKYFELKQEYKDLSLEHSYFKIASHKAAYKELELKIAEEKEKVKKIAAAVKKLEEQVEKEKLGNIDKEKALAAAQRNLNQLVGQIKGKEHDKKMLAQKSLFIEQNSQKLDVQIRQAETKLAENAKDIEKYTASFDSEQKILKILSTELAAAKAGLEEIRGKHGKLKTELAVFVNQQNELNKAVFEQEKQLAIQKNQKENSERNIERINRNLQQRSQEMLQVQQQSKTLEGQQQTQERHIQQLKDAEQLRRSNLEEAEKELEQVREKLVSKNRILDSRRNEFRLLKSMIENMEGFPESIKFLSRNKAWKANAPLLSDIFYCGEEYRAAIESYLEGYLSYYVVENMIEAIQAIELLDQHKKGKANFFLLDKFPDKIDSKKPADIGVAALDVLQIDDQYKRLATALLGNVRIVDKLSEAKQYELGSIWLTRDGKYTQRAFSMRGGSVGAFEGKKIGRKKNLEKLDKKIVELQSETLALQTQQISLTKRQNELRAANKQRDIQRAEQQLNQIIRQALSLKSKLESFESFKKDSEGQRKGYENQIERLKDKGKEAYKDLERLNEKMEALKNQVSLKDSSFRTIAEDLSKASSDYNQKHIEQVRQQNKIGGIERELNFCKRQETDIKEQLEKNKQTLERAGSDISNTQQQIKLAGETLEDWYKEKKERQEATNLAEKAYFDSKGDIAGTEEDLRHTNKNYQNSVQLAHQLENKFGEVKLQLTSLGERLKIEFEIDINEIFNNDPDPTLDEAILETKVAELRKKLSGYGTINAMAIEAYDEMKERNDFIQKERKDLLESKATLMETMTEIENEATTKFMQAFTMVRGHFIRVFRSLFEQDDTCDLLLTDPDKPLDSKIEIVAKPKGKRPLTINQLSGGEKTLTATALLFALYLLKPAPFCIFDEVDAPLDDANIAKFNNIIKDFSKHSQFIVVTHNKKTMESVDIMYGVTMVQGVSKVVPVDFRNLDAVT